MSSGTLTSSLRIKEREKAKTVGLACSAVLHVALVFAMLGAPGFQKADRESIEIYSISIEGGQTLGGLSQVPKEKSDKAPPVPTANKTKQAPESVEKKPEKEEKEQPEELPEDEDAVQIKPKTTPTPKPEVKKEEKKVEATPTPAPTKKPQATPKKTQPAKQKQPSLADLEKRLAQAVQRYQGESTNAGGEGFGAASRTAGEGMGGGIQRPPEFFTYRDTIERIIKSGFAWHDSRMLLESRVCFSISPEGIVSALNLCQESGNRFFDDAALRAVSKSSPLPPPPPSVVSFFENVRIHFSSVE